VGDVTAIHRGRDDFRANDAANLRRSWNDTLPRKFFSRPSTLVAPDLLGCVLVHDTPQGRVAIEIVEVEAYTGNSDPASHAFRGKTARNAVMFGEPGHSYVYFTYGMHFCVNLVCQPAGEAAAVLLRAGRVIAGDELALARRAARRGADAGGSAGGGVGGEGGAAIRKNLLASGPARLCQALGIDRAQNGSDACDPGSPLRVLARPGCTTLPPASIAVGPRVGVRTGAEVSWRYWIAGDDAVSAYRPHVPKRRRAPGAAGRKPV
jgi:DNA-3-methyladenine glycosylase